MRRNYLYFVALFMLVVVSSCGAARQKGSTAQPLLSDDLHAAARPTMAAHVSIPRQVATPTPKPTLAPTKPVVTPTLPPTPTPAPAQTSPGPAPTNIPSSGIGAAPYGPPPPMTAEEIDLTQRIFGQINSDRAVRGLYPFSWNDVLAGGARLHAWNMVHCGFSHTCPDGRTQCQRIADEGFTGYTDCGENIAYAGPYPTPWQGVHNIQEGMINEPPDGWHRIHLTSTTLHRVGVGVYVDSSGYIWFVEDMVS